MLLIVLIIFAGLYALYRYNKWKFQYWERRRVPHLKPDLIFGSLTDAVFSKKSIGTVYADIYSVFHRFPYVGLYLGRRPGLMVRDPRIIRDVLVKDFTSFHDNDLDIDEKKDPIFGCNPFNSKGELWKTRRALHTSHYTSGKVKSMLPLLDQVGTIMQEYVQQEINESEGLSSIDATELAAKFTVGNVANCALGINGRTFETWDAELLVAGRKLLKPKFLDGLSSFLIFVFPWLANFLSVSVVPSGVTQTFKRLVGEVLQYRKENNIVRNDFFDSVKEYKGKECTIRDVMVMVGGFYLDGVITSSIAMTFVLYELASNPVCQEILRKEIDDALKKNNGSFTYEVLQDMPYLEAVIFEGLRMYPPLTQFTKVCTKEFTIPPSVFTPTVLRIPVGTPVIIPTLGLHYDGKYFPNARKFDPDRFLGGNKEAIPKYTYLPFGVGPRTCVGMHFAILQLKVGLTKLISAFEISLHSRTMKPIVIDPSTVLLTSKQAVWIDFCERKKG